MKFGIELEFFLLDSAGFPALGSTEQVIRLWRCSRFRHPPVPELGSFQIELNPGPWPLTRAGIERGVHELRQGVARLNHCAAQLGYTVCTTPIVPEITNRYLREPSLLSGDARSRATSAYFRDRSATVTFDTGERFVFPGESVLACLNEIHIHVQPANDAAAIVLFNKLNETGEDLIRAYQSPIFLNGQLFAQRCTTMRLFEEADGEPDTSGLLRRVGFLPYAIASYADYRKAILNFRPIPCPEMQPPFLDLESSVWLWTRLRGKPGELRVEFRPMDMGPDWEDRVRFLADTAYELAGANEPTEYILQEQQ